MKHFFLTVAGVLVGLFLFMVILPAALITMALSSTPAGPSAIVLNLDLRAPIPDQAPLSPFSALAGVGSTVEIVRDLEAAARDHKVRGVIVRANTTGMAPAQAEEIRTAIKTFRESGKFVYAHLQNDSLETSLAGYSAIAGADQVWLQETGDLMPMGVAAEEMFLGGLFQKFSMQPQFEKRKEYKNAVNSIVEKGFTPAHREASVGLITSLYDTLTANIAVDRKMSAVQAKAAVEATPYPAADAVKAKLADQLGRPEDMEAAALEAAGGADHVELVDLLDYHPAKRRGPMIALVGAEGAIVTGPTDPSPFGGDAIVESDTTARALIEAGQDPEVRAIVFRVSSPGGSAVASDQILNAVKIAQANGKKVVVSMGEYAASGGYYISAPADEIVASPSTITGSIGIYGGKIVVGQALEKYLGVTTDEVKVGSQYVNLFSAAQSFTPAQRQVFAAAIDRGYADFKAKVAEGRKMNPARVEEIAKGRVWTGTQAKALGLVDHLGGLNVAVERAKALAGIDQDDEVRLRLYPEPRNPVEELQALFGVSREAARAAAGLSLLMSDTDAKAALDRMAQERRQGQLRARAEGIEVR